MSSAEDLNFGSDAPDDRDLVQAYLRVITVGVGLDILTIAVTIGPLQPCCVGCFFSSLHYQTHANPKYDSKHHGILPHPTHFVALLVLKLPTVWGCLKAQNLSICTSVYMPYGYVNVVTYPAELSCQNKPCE